MKGLLLFLVFSAFSASAMGATHYVPDDFPTIQAAIDDPLVGTGDVVVVRAGVYPENLNFKGKAITLTSEDGADHTFINGGFLGSVVTFDQGEGNDTILEGFTITNGTAYNGGGIHCYDASPTIRYNIISDNKADFLGGGISCSSCSPLIHDNLIQDNHAGRGGGIGVERLSEPKISHNVIQFNYAGLSGAGIVSYCASPRIVDNYIYRNHSNKYAGGIGGGDFSHMTIDGNQIVDNWAKVYAGGIICATNSSFNISNCLITRNEAGIYGGGMFIRRTLDVVISNTIISYNTAQVDGGGLYFTFDYSGPSLVRNCTLYGNEAFQTGGGVYSMPTASQLFVNTIIRENTAVNNRQIYAATTTQLEAVFCNLEEGWPGEGNIDTAAAFADPDNNDFHLTWLSPCINRGTEMNAPPKDMDGDGRPCMGAIDMGVDEFTDTHALEANVFEIRIATGGSIQFTLDGGIQNSGREYIILGSMSGTVPGLNLPGNLANLPLNWDLFTDYVLANLNTPTFTRFNQHLGATGKGTALYNTPPIPVGYLGVVCHFAYCLIGPSFDFVSNPVPVTFIN